MFGRNKTTQEELEKLKKYEAIDDVFFSGMEEKREMFGATVSELDESCRQAEADVAQLRENIRTAETLASDNVQIEEDLTFAIGNCRSALEEAKERQIGVNTEVRGICDHIMELVEENKHFTTPSKILNEYSTGAKNRNESLLQKLDQMQEYGKHMGVLALNAAIEAGRLGSPGKQFVGAAEDIRNYAANYDQAIADSKKEIEASSQKIEELEEQVRRLVALLKENNISTAKLMKTCSETAEHADALAESAQIDRLTEISHQVTTLRNADEEIVKSEERNRMQTEDLAAEFAAQKRHQTEIQELVDQLYHHVVERRMRH
jgi:hypothetical protein